MEKEWAAYSFDYPLVVKRIKIIIISSIFIVSFSFFIVLSQNVFPFENCSRIEKTVTKYFL